MKKLHPLLLNDTLIEVVTATTPQEWYKGLSGVDKLGSKKGMLFIYPQAIRPQITMRGMNFPIDLLFVDKNWEVREIHSLDKNSKNDIISQVPVHFALEVNRGLTKEAGLHIGRTLYPDPELIEVMLRAVKKFEKGGSLELIGDKIYTVKIDDVPLEPDKLQVLNTKGEVVANVGDGARVFSREHTKKLIELSKKNKLEELGRELVEILTIQETQKDEYVTK
jgi:uncharacterized membrane protein (UPF0127 family)